MRDGCAFKRRTASSEKEKAKKSKAASRSSGRGGDGAIGRFVGSAGAVIVNGTASFWTNFGYLIMIM
ncbi:hypothetical protein FJ949_20235 [Mesorhizobium sp. B2-4-1]|nr:hypothetical protein FJW11_23280 [Mesorhizobium sp. B3-1-1]TPJ64958.1 hypothetical protein FJ462_20855 [Mesorhizobium sp. B2-6-7]TPJ80859.1 hypothetical protein FJ422_22085 [Mesorhizobium sp. B2-6-3]TPK02171.1 hypothetical protein FJ491_10005 [Mesorhizobium sp. B2-5-10]TPK05402.1 hypothetical protein FJ490_27335 [Mesorhizobium sp. B2-5-11]TPK28650.1 hypothetical protein FJ885_25555 [Mesorhizobium sp. B2-5-8]TPK30810.1 hypothetical protein FJ867_23630 [Mesorhizobium sp. B2-5-3]TPL14223.1 h